MYPSYQATKSYKKPVEKAVNATKDWIYDNRHELLDLAALGASFIFPPAAVAIELYNAKLYFDEGDSLMGSITTIFAALPIIGSIPGVKQGLGFVLKRGVKYSQKQIKKILEVVLKNKNKIRRQMLAIEAMIKKFPHLNIDKYLDDLIAGKIDSKTFYKNFKGYNDKMEVIKINKPMPLQHISPDPALTVDKLNLTGFLDNIKNLKRPPAAQRAAKNSGDALDQLGGFYNTKPGEASFVYKPSGNKPYYNYELKAGARGLDLRTGQGSIDGISVGSLTKYKNDGFDFIIGTGKMGKPEVLPLNKFIIQNWRRGNIYQPNRYRQIGQ